MPFVLNIVYFFNPDNPDITPSPVKEYFVPYSLDILIEVVKDKYLLEQLNYAKRKQKTFDNYVERHIDILADNPHIKKIPNDIEKLSSEKEPIWISDETSIDELSAWDYLADAKAITTAIELKDENPELVNIIAETTMISRLKLDRLKLILSILIYIDDPDFDPSDNDDKHPKDSSPSGEFTIDNMECRKSLINFYKKKIKKLLKQNLIKIEN